MKQRVALNSGAVWYFPGAMGGDSAVGAGTDEISELTPDNIIGRGGGVIAPPHRSSPLLAASIGSLSQTQFTCKASEVTRNRRFVAGEFSGGANQATVIICALEAMAQATAGSVPPSSANGAA